MESKDDDTDRTKYCLGLNELHEQVKHNARHVTNNSGFPGNELSIEFSFVYSDHRIDPYEYLANSICRLAYKDLMPILYEAINIASLLRVKTMNTKEEKEAENLVHLLNEMRHYMRGDCE